MGIGGILLVACSFNACVLISKLQVSVFFNEIMHSSFIYFEYLFFVTVLHLFDLAGYQHFTCPSPSLAVIG